MTRNLLRNQRGDGDLFIWVVFAVIGLAGYGCYQLFINSELGGARNRPRMIDADGQTYVACLGSVSVSKEGGGLLGGGSETFEVKFTDASGLAYELHGVRKVALTDIPKLVTAPFPVNPSMTDNDGKPYVNGTIYSWSDGSKAKFNSGAWEPVQVPNNVCPAKPNRVP